MDERALALFGVLLWAALCCTVAALGRARTLAKELKEANAETRREREERVRMQAERDTAMQRHEARKAHCCIIRDEEIERLNREIGAWEKKYRVLESVINRMWEDRR